MHPSFFISVFFEEANLLFNLNRLDYLFSENEDGKSLLEKASREFQGATFLIP